MLKVNLNTDEFVKQADDAIDKIDDLRNEELVMMYKLLEFKQKSLRIEQKRIEGKYGPDDEQLAPIVARLAFNEQLLPVLGQQIKELQLKTPVPDPNVWILYGHLVDSQFQPAGKMPLGLTDENEQTIRLMPQTVTDADGYYELTVNKDLVGKMKGKVLVALFVKGKSPLVLSAGPVSPALGTITNEDLELPRDDSKLIRKKVPK